jgi:hypothetical protein
MFDADGLSGCCAIAQPGAGLPSVYDAREHAAAYRSARKTHNEDKQQQSPAKPHQNTIGKVTELSMGSINSIQMQMVPLDLDAERAVRSQTSMHDIFLAQSFLPKIDMSNVDKALFKANEQKRQEQKRLADQDEAAAKTDEALAASTASFQALQSLEQNSSDSPMNFVKSVNIEIKETQRTLHLVEEHERSMVTSAASGLSLQARSELMAAEHTMRERAPMPKALVGKYANFSSHAIGQARRLKQKERMDGGSEAAVAELQEQLNAMTNSRHCQKKLKQQEARGRPRTERPQSAPSRRIGHPSSRPSSAYPAVQRFPHSEAQDEHFKASNKISYQLPGATSFEARFFPKQLSAIQKRRRESASAETRIKTLLRKSKIAVQSDQKEIADGHYSMADERLPAFPLNLETNSLLGTESLMRSLVEAPAAQPLSEHHAQQLWRRRAEMLNTVVIDMSDSEEETGPDKLAVLLRTVQQRKQVPLAVRLHPAMQTKPHLIQSPEHASLKLKSRPRPPGRDIPMWFGPYSREDVKALKEMFDEIDAGKCNANSRCVLPQQQILSRRWKWRSRHRRVYDERIVRGATSHTCFSGDIQDYPTRTFTGLVGCCRQSRSHCSARLMSMAQRNWSSTSCCKWPFQM